MANFLIGTEVKFAVDLTAVGFDMDRDDFELTVVDNRGNSVTASKGSSSPDEKLIIYRESDSSSSSEDSSSSGDEGTWFAIFNSEGINPGPVKVVANAKIPDDSASGAIRTELAVEVLGTFKNPV